MSNAQEDISGIGRQVMRRLRQRRGSAMGLRMAPMIDVIFLLLTFFVLTARFRVPEQFLPINLPSAVQARSIGVVEPLVLDISADNDRCIVRFGPEGKSGASVIGAEAIDADLAAFVSKTVEVLKSQRRHVGDPIEIICSDEVRWDYLVKIYNMLYAMGINDITFAMTE